MNYIETNQKLNICTDSFSPFDGALVIFEDNDFHPKTKLTDKNIKQIMEDVLDFSWDGAIYWFNHDNGLKFLEHLREKLPTFLDKVDSTTDTGFSNVILYAKTKTGYVFVDTQVDYGSVVEEILEDFEIKPKYLIYDSHLIDNLKLGRNDKEGDEFYYFLYKEGIINESFFYCAEESISESVVSERNIVLTGEFSIPIEDIKYSFENINFKDEVTSNDDWLWCGDNVDDSKIADAQIKGAKISTIEDVIEHYFKIIHP